MVTDLSAKIAPDELTEAAATAEPVDPGLVGLTVVAGYYRIAADPWQLKHQLAISGRLADAEDLIRGGRPLVLLGAANPPTGLRSVSLKPSRRKRQPAI